MDVRLATFNLENLGIRPGRDTPEVRGWLRRHQGALRDTIRRLEADAVAFQELVDPSLLAPLIEGLGYPYCVVGERAGSPLLVGVFSRYPLVDPRAVARSAEVAVTDQKTGIEIGVRGAFSRSALQVVWDVPGLRTTLLVVHWKSKIPSPTPSRGKGEEPWSSFGDAGEGRLVTEAKRLAQALQVRRAVDRLLSEDPEARVAVLGDFNDGPDSEALRIVRGDARACLSPALAPAELLPCELSLPPSTRYTQLYRGRPEMLDHILISRALLPHFTGARVLNEFLRDADATPAPDSPAEAGSDHAPLVATFRV